ncbi:MAG: proline--tRNA ligase [Candidatus Hodarchaeales archaeon]|jgi:prolyl-tRNA synthetase
MNSKLTNKDKEEKALLTEKVTFNIDKSTNFNEWYNEIIRLAELVDMRYGVKGFIVYREWSTISIKKIFQAFEELLEVDGHSPTIFPIVIPESNFEKEKEHVAGFTPEVLWVTEAGSEGRLEERLALRPTSETAMYPLYSLWIRSYRDLPLKHYQSGPVWRYETKATRPFVRGREFWWIESHDVFITEKNAIKQVQMDLEISRKVLNEKLGMPLLQFKRPQWDKFAGADETFVSDVIMPNGRFLQLPSTHLLGQGFAKAFDITFLDQNNQEAIAYQTCYGPGITRIYGGVIATHGDNAGLILPYWIAPIQIVIIPILAKKKNPEQIMEKCNNIADFLKNTGMRVKIDDLEARPGDKYYFWEMKGVPFRLEIGAKEVESGKFTLFVRDNRIRIKDITSDNLIQVIQEQGELMLERLKEKAWDAVKNLIVTEVEDIKELRKLIKQGKVAKIPYCTIEMEGEGCFQILKEETGGGDIRGPLVENYEDIFEIKDLPEPGMKCLGCGKDATLFVYIGKQY